MALLRDSINISEDHRRLYTQFIDRDDNCPQTIGDDRYSFNPVIHNTGDEKFTELYRAKQLLATDLIKNIIDTDDGKTSQETDGQRKLADIGRSGLTNMEETKYKQISNINQLCFEEFQLILAKLIDNVNWRQLIPFRRVSKYWRTNIDSYLATKKGFRYMGRWTEHNGTQILNHYVLNAMLNHFPNLQQLIINEFITGDDLIAILTDKVPHLIRLDISRCYGITWMGYYLMALHFQKLEYLDISDCKMDEDCLRILISHLQNLKTINIDSGSPQMTGKCLAQLGPNIEDVWIAFGHQNDMNATLQALVSGHGKNIIHFGLYLYDYNSTDLTIISKAMKNLKSFKLTFGSTGKSTLNPLKHLANLEFLVLTEFPRHTQESVLTDKSMHGVLKSTPKLKSLKLMCLRPDSCRFTDFTVANIVRYCKNIQQLQLANSDSLTDRALTMIAEIPHLQVLSFMWVNNITNDGMKALAEKAPKLKSLQVYDCPNITENILDCWIEVANRRKNTKFKLKLGHMGIQRNLTTLPSNLIVINDGSDH